MRLEVLMVMNVWTVVIQDMMLCTWAGRYQCSSRKCCL